VGLDGPFLDSQSPLFLGALAIPFQQTAPTSDLLRVVEVA
jgi:hypothetical protein